jgi:hypothetical protein
MMSMLFSNFENKTIAVMKKIFGLMIILMIAASCNTAKFSTTGDKEKKYIDNFLSLMGKDNEPKYTELMKCISPKYIKDNNINTSAFKVDNYTNWGHSIESYSDKGLVIAKIWGQDRGWVHKLTFKLSKEKGKLYIVPSAHSENYISPWWEKQTYIKENK